VHQPPRMPERMLLRFMLCSPEKIHSARCVRNGVCVPSVTEIPMIRSSLSAGSQ
jgi:hypothetical protein